MWGFWIRLSPVISLLCSIVKVVSRSRPKRIVMHVCLWGKYLIKLDKLLSWGLISINFQYYNHSLLSYNHSHAYIVYHGKQTLEVTFLKQSFSLYLKKLQNIIVLLYPSVFYIHTSEWKFCKNYICRQTARQYSHANKSNTVTAKEDTKRKFSYCNVIWAMISWFLSSSDS